MNTLSKKKSRFVCINDWGVDISSRKITNLISGKHRYLGEYQSKLLHVLLNNIDIVQTKEELISAVWEERVVGSNSLSNAVHALRTALDDDDQIIIKTIPRTGYLLSGDHCILNNMNYAVDDQLTNLNTDKNKASSDSKEQSVNDRKNTLKIFEGIFLRTAKYFIFIKIILIMLFFNSIYLERELKNFFINNSSTHGICSAWYGGMAI